MKQITPTVYEWSRCETGGRRDGNGHFIQAAPGEAGVLVDPVPFNDGDGDHVRSLGGVAAVVLTSATRARTAAQCTAAFGCPTLVPEPALAALTGTGLSVRGYGPAAALPAGLVPVAVPHGAAPGAGALYSATSGGTLVVGDAVVGEPLGCLSLPRRGDAGAMAAAARGLRALLGLPAARLLVAYGQSVVRDPRPLLQDLLFEHDPEAYLLRAEESRWCTDPSPGPRFGARRAEYTRLLGLTVLDFELVELPPGRQNYPLHGHDGKEELFLVTEGRGEALTERGGTARRTAIGPGDVLAFPPRFQVAHAIVNTGTAPLRFYVFGVPAEALDMVDFPESHVRGEYTPFGKRYRFRLPAERDLPYWDGVRTT